MIGPLVPPGVIVVEVHGDLPITPDLDRSVLPRAVDSRWREFATARRCARIALRRLGEEASTTVPRGSDGQPLWPTGVVGSITHCQSYRAAAVARVIEFGGIGIDAEPNEPLPDDVIRLCTLPAEREAFPHDPAVAWDRLAFSAKEAVFKTVFPGAREWLDFVDVSISFEGSSFRPIALDPVPSASAQVIAEIRGAWSCVGGYLFASASAPVPTGTREASPAGAAIERTGV